MNPRGVWLLAVVATSVLLAACEDPRRPVVPSSSGSPAPPATTVAAPAATGVVPQLGPPSPLPALPLALRAAISGWSDDPRPISAFVTRSLAPGPPFRFRARAGDSDEVVVYDLAAGQERSLGSGSMPRFNPAITRLAWVGGAKVGQQWTELRVLDLASANVLSVGAAGFIIGWIDNDHVAVVEGGRGAASIQAVVDVRSGARTSGTGVSGAIPPPSAIEAAGYRLEPDSKWALTYRVTNLASGETFLFEAPGGATLTPDGKVVAATSSRVRPNSNQIDVLAPWSVYIIDPRDRVATFVASAEYGGIGLRTDSGFIMWQASPCAPGHAVYLFDRSSGILTRLMAARGYARFIGDGRVGLGWFQPTIIFDPATFDQLVAFPPEFINLQWSSDFKWAAVGTEGGRDAGCN